MKIKNLPCLFPLQLIRLTTKSFSAIPFEDATSQTFETLSHLLDDYYRDKADDQKQQTVNRSIMKLIQKRTGKISQARSGVKATDNAEEFAKKENSATTFLHQVPNDQDQVVLDNYYTNEPITIQLNKGPDPPIKMPNAILNATRS